MIIGEIRRHLRDYNPIRVSRSLRDTAYKAMQMREKLTHERNREPTIKEIADELGITEKEIITAMDAIQDPVSLFEPVYHDGADALFIMDQVSDKNNTDDMWLENITLKDALNHLSDRERHIINMRFFKGKTQMEVASEVGISQAQVSRLEKSALKNMKRYM
jgi:RNA polymerase sporulation-specific sigma factor